MAYKVELEDISMYGIGIQGRARGHINKQNIFNNNDNPARNGQLPGRQWGTSGGDGGWKMESVVDQKSSCHHPSLDIIYDVPES